MTSQAISTSRIDHFSSLPNELLDQIFDLAYLRPLTSSRVRLGEPLSKRLLPFYLRLLHHTFSPSRWKSVYLLNQASILDSALNNQIKQVDFESLSAFKSSQEVSEFEFLLRRIPNVEEVHFTLDESNIPRIFWNLLYSRPRLFPKLRSLQIELLDNVGGLPSPITGLAPLRHLQSLTHLTVLWPDYSFVSTYAPILLPNVKYLSIRGDGSANVSCLSLVQSCPSLELLELNGDEADGGLDDVLLGLPRTLPGLRLNGPFSRPVDQSLVHLTGLQRLHLGEDSYGTDLALHLSSLPLLATLTLDEASDDVKIVGSIVNGRHRLQALKHLTLNFHLGWNVGTRVDLNQSVQEQLESKNCHDYRNRLRYNRDQLLTLEVFMKMARHQGITVEGNAVELRKKMEMCIVESHNRGLLRLVWTGDSIAYEEALELAFDYRYALPQINLDRFDFSRCRIVKIEVPDQDWFLLRLEEQGWIEKNFGWIEKSSKFSERKVYDIEEEGEIESGHSDGETEGEHVSWKSVVCGIGGLWSGIWSACLSKGALRI